MREGSEEADRNDQMKQHPDRPPRGNGYDIHALPPNIFSARNITGSGPAMLSISSRRTFFVGRTASTPPDHALRQIHVNPDPVSKSTVSTWITSKDPAT
jgi:hypothetical protein